MAIITRYLSEENCDRAKEELGFLFEHLVRYRGELAIELRGPSELSVYDRGLRLARISFRRGGTYRMTTHRRFIAGTPLGAHLDPGAPPEGYEDFDNLTARELHHLLSKKNIDAMRPCIKRIPSKEELGVAHVIAADTMEGADLFVVDREVGDSAEGHRGERLDLLALQQVPGGQYRFLAIEVKLGNNPELDVAAQARRGKRHAAEQVLGYVEQIDQFFDEYAACYRRNVEQKITLGLLGSWRQAPEIVPGAQALLVVAGYSGIAAPLLRELGERYPELWVRTFDYRLRSEDGCVVGLS
jgi:hypothetical protein